MQNEKVDKIESSLNDLLLSTDMIVYLDKFGFRHSDSLALMDLLNIFVSH